MSSFHSWQKRDECIQKLAPVLWLQLNNCRRKAPNKIKDTAEKWRHHVSDGETAPSPANNKATNWLTGRVKMVMERSGVGALCSFLKCPTKETNGGVKLRENNKCETSMNKRWISVLLFSVLLLILAIKHYEATFSALKLQCLYNFAEQWFRQATGGRVKSINSKFLFWEGYIIFYLFFILTTALA